MLVAVVELVAVLLRLVLLVVQAVEVLVGMSLETAQMVLQILAVAVEDAEVVDNHLNLRVLVDQVLLFCLYLLQNILDLLQVAHQ
jgi:hypothetical protein